jgi:hypothetical protein
MSELHGPIYSASGEKTGAYAMGNKPKTTLRLIGDTSGIPDKEIDTGVLLLTNVSTDPQAATNGLKLFSDNTNNLYFIDSSGNKRTVSYSASTTPSQLYSWIAEATGSFTAAPSDTDTLAMSDTTNMKIGTPIKYVIGGNTGFGMVKAVTDNTNIDIVGSPLSGSLSALYYGDRSRVVTTSLFVSGTYGDGANTDLLASDMNTYFKWRMGKAYLVSFSAVHKTPDTGTQAKVNVQINNAAVSTNDSNNGIQLSASSGTWVDNGAVEINTNNYDINFDEELEVACAVSRQNRNGSDLTLMLSFVME